MSSAIVIVLSILLQCYFQTCAQAAEPNSLPSLRLQPTIDSMNTTSESLLHRLGNTSSIHRTDAWHTFSQLYTPLIFYWGRKIGLQSQDAADLVQDVMAIVFQKLPQFQYDSSKSFRGWLRKVTLNQYRQQCRRRTLSTVAASDSLLANCAGTDAAEQTWDQDYARSLFREAMQTMQGDFSKPVWDALQQMLILGQSVTAVASANAISPTRHYTQLAIG